MENIRAGTLIKFTTLLITSVSPGILHMFTRRNRQSQSDGSIIIDV